MLRPYRFLVVVAWCVFVWVAPRPDGVELQAWRLLALFSGTILGMILQVMDTGAVVFLGLVAAILTRAMTATAVLGGFSNSSVWLIVSAFLFSNAVVVTGLGQRVAYCVHPRLRARTLSLGYALAASELVMAPAVPANTARAGGILFPIVTSIARACGSLPGPVASPPGRVSHAEPVSGDHHSLGHVPDLHGGEPADRRNGGKNRRGEDHLGPCGRPRRGFRACCRSLVVPWLLVPAAPAGNEGVAGSARGGAAPPGRNGTHEARRDLSRRDCKLLPAAVDHHLAARPRPHHGRVSRTGGHALVRRDDSGRTWCALRAPGTRCCGSAA